MASCTLSRTSPQLDRDDKFRNVIRVHWNIETDDHLAGPQAALSVARNNGPDSIPNIWSSYSLWPGESDSSIFLRSVKIRRRHEGSNRLWVAEGEYRPPDPGQEQGDSNENPLLRPTKYRLEHVTFTEVIEEDKDGNPLQNSAGVEFEIPIESEQSRMILVAEKNYPSLQDIINLNLAFGGKVNSDTYRGASPRMWLCHSIRSSDILSENGVTYYTGTFSLEINWKTWDRRILDRGLSQLVDGKLEHIMIVTEDGEKVRTAEPQNLDLNGKKLPDNETGKHIHFRVRDEVAFGGLGV